jgi:transcription elongation GreA/GreB family factor
LEITVITAASPLGRQLIKRQEGSIFLMESGDRRLETVILSVC